MVWLSFSCCVFSPLLSRFLPYDFANPGRRKRGKKRSDKKTKKKNRQSKNQGNLLTHGSVTVLEPAPETALSCFSNTVLTPPHTITTNSRYNVMMKFKHIAPLMVLLLTALSHTSGTSSYYDISYVSFSSPIVTPLPSLSKRISLAIVSDADDSPFQLVALPFPFNYFGRMIYNVFASPNGALHQSISQPCPCNCFMEITSTTSCNYNTSYTGLIAGFLTDLDPSNSLSANVTYYKGAGYLSVIYSSIPMFDPLLSHQSFRINLYNDSRVTILYDSIFPNATKRGGTYPPLITGLRPPTTARHWNITMDQQQVGMTQWKTTYPGIYPLYQNVKSGMQFTGDPFALPTFFT